MRVQARSRMLGGFLGTAMFLGAGVAPADELTVFDRPSATSTQPANTGDADLAALQLSGVSSLGGQRMFNLVDSRNNKSFWVPMNGSANGFSVTAYDEQTVTVTVTRNGQARQVALRQVKIAAMPTAGSTPASVQVPARPPGSPPVAVVRTADGGEIVNPKTPQEIAQAEMEARMMVSDLLEISMQERARQKALREAQKQQGGQPLGAAAPAPAPASH